MKSTKDTFDNLNTILRVTNDVTEQTKEIACSKKESKVVKFEEFSLDNMPDIKKNKDFFEDYSHARRVLQSLSEQAQGLMIEALNEAKMTTHPESILAANQTITTVKEVLESLIKMHQQLDKRMDDNSTALETGTTTNNLILFEGTTLEFLQQMQRTKQEIIEGEARVIEKNASN